MTWASLLAGWMEIARASRALGTKGPDAAWKASIPAIITLDALTFALADLKRLDESERQVAIDRAGVLLSRHRAELERTWAGRGVPEEVAEMVSDAQKAHEAALARWRSGP